MAQRATPFNNVWFRFDDLQDELENLAQIADDLLVAGSSTELVSFARSLDALRIAKSGQGLSWTIPRGRPLRTVPTVAYERGKGPHQVFGQFTVNWTVSTVDKDSGKQGRAKYLCVSGAATTVVELFRLLEPRGKSRIIGRWGVDVATFDGPGFAFHAQIRGRSGTAGPDKFEFFPAWISVPRLPSCLLTPASVIEFALGELFQTEWRDLASRSLDPQLSWNKIQKERLKRLFAWKLGTVGSAVTSPWVSLKYSYPSSTLFVAD